MSRTLGTYLVEMLAANGIDTVFGVPGVHNLELYRGLSACGLRHVLTRHEQGAGFAADGHARLSGRPAAVFTISGPGLSNVLTAAAQAHSDSVPLLVVASTPPAASLGKGWGVLHELRDQCALAGAVFGTARSARRPEDVRDHLRECFSALRAGRARPAYLEVPLDLLAASTALPAERFPDPPAPPAPSSASLAAAIRLIERAERPVVVAGGGARHAAAAVAALVEALDCPLVTTTAGKGLMPFEHPLNVGSALQFAPVQSLVARADVVLAVGTELGETDLFEGLKLDLRGALVRVDIDAAKLADHYAADVPVWGDARPALEAIAAALTPRVGWRSRTGGAAALHAEIERGADAKVRGQRRALDALRAGLSADGVVFSDMTQIAYLGNYAFATDAPDHWFHPAGYGTLGFALPAALGAKLACPARPVVALAGDYGSQFTLNELMTAVEARIGLPVIVWNNAALGQIRDDMARAGIPLVGVTAQNPDFVGLARACGAAGVRVTNPSTLTTALRTALARGAPTLIEVAAEGF